jgi:hypothetical protein
MGDGLLDLAAKQNGLVTRADSGFRLERRPDSSPVVGGRRDAHKTIAEHSTAPYVLADAARPGATNCTQLLRRRTQTCDAGTQLLITPHTVVDSKAAGIDAVPPAADHAARSFEFTVRRFARVKVSPPHTPGEDVRPSPARGRAACGGYFFFNSSSAATRAFSAASCTRAASSRAR